MEQERITIFYKIGSPNGRSYVGQTVDLDARLRQYKNLRCKSQRFLHASFQKYGFSEHSIECLHRLPCTKELADLMETEYIEMHASHFTQGGMNISLGGGGVRGLTGKLSPRFGSTMNEKTRQAIKAANTGRKASAQTRILQSQNNPMRNSESYNKMVRAVQSAEVRKKISDNVPRKCGGENNRARRIAQLDLNMNELRIWDSIVEAAEYLNTRPNSIRKVLTGERDTHKGFVWRYV